MRYCLRTPNSGSKEEKKEFKIGGTLQIKRASKSKSKKRMKIKKDLN
jgi:hypothetical protein